MPAGSVARFDWAGAPYWLRLMKSIPFLDRFCYPALVGLGLGILVVYDPERFDEASATAQGWVVAPALDGDAFSRGDLGS